LSLEKIEKQNYLVIDQRMDENSPEVDSRPSKAFRISLSDGLSISFP
jgi:hypothetical protein